MATETASQRLKYLRRFDPLLASLVARGMLSDGDADIVVIAAQSIELHRELRIAVPGGSSELSGFIALDVAVRRLVDPGRYGVNPTCLITSAPWRTIHSLSDVAGEVISKDLRAVRLRGDGSVQEIHSSRTRSLVGADRLVFITPRVRWPKLEILLGTVIVDAAALGDALDEALAWARENSEIVIEVAGLDPTLEPSGFEVDWPLIQFDSPLWGRVDTWPSKGVVQIESVGEAPDGLEEARREIAAAPRDSDPWPAQLIAAAGLSRALATVAVPLSLYDAHTAKSIATSFADRVEALDAIRPSDFPSTWSTFAATSWPGIKRHLLDAAASLETNNPKAASVGLAVERLLAEGTDVTIWVNSMVHARAVETHLLTAGFGVSPDDFEIGRIAAEVISTRRPSERRTAASLITGLPSSWQLPALVSDKMEGPLVVLAYDFERVRIPGYFGWLLNANRLSRHDDRVILIARTLGSGLDCGVAPLPVPIAIECYDQEGVSIKGPMELGEDTAELAALADDEWLNLTLQRRERASGLLDDTMLPALAFLVDPGPSVLLVAENAMVDRLVAGRLRPMPASALRRGMMILGSSSGGETVFDRVRPFLDRLQGIGARFWLDRWDDALMSALTECGGRMELAKALVDSGASIGVAAVAAWPSPYRIGPRDEDNVLRVAQIGHSVPVAHNARRVHAVMRGVRTEHMKLGRLLSSAVRRHLTGDIDAFDSVEEILGVAIEDLLGEVSVSTIRDCLGRGFALGSTLGRIHSPTAAQRYFVRETSS